MKVEFFIILLSMIYSLVRIIFPCEFVWNFLFKMASSSDARAQQNYTTEEVINAVFADDDSEDEDFAVPSEEESTEESSGEESSDNEFVPPAPVVKRCRTRGGKVNNPAVPRKQTSKEQQKIAKEVELEHRWKHQDDGDFPIIPEFTADSKINAHLPEDPTPIDVFNLFFDDDLYNLLTTQTNLYAHQYREAHPMLPRHSRARYWNDVTIEEMKKFLALHFLTGIVQKPEINQYWSTNPLLKTSVFNQVMSRNRFQVILDFLHFNDNSHYDPNDPNRDRLYKVRPLIDHLVSKFKSVYTPSRDISIDEELMLWKGRLHFKQYIPNKRSRFGIKFFSLCEATGYLWNSYVYLGKQNNVPADEAELIKKLGISGAVVPKLMSELYGKGYHVYMDNWYTSEKLYLHLEENGSAACGTAKRNRLSVPKSMKTKKMIRGDTEFRRDNNLLMLRYQDKKEVYFLSTIHKSNVATSGKKKRDGTDLVKPVLVNDYNKYMGGIDRNDAMMGNYSSVRKTLKWTTKVAIHFMEEAVLNSFIIYNKFKGNQRFMQFKLTLIRMLLDVATHDSTMFSIPTIGRHFLQLIPPTKKKQNPQKRCIVCTKAGKRKESRYQCKNCIEFPGLCPAPCFEEHHTK